MLHSLAYAIAYTPGMTYSNSSTTGTITQVRSQRVGSRQSADPQSRPTRRVGRPAESADSQSRPTPRVGRPPESADPQSRPSPESADSQSAKRSTFSPTVWALTSWISSGYEIELIK